MDGLRDDFLAGARLSEDQRRIIGRATSRYSAA
jgi:hypothetical protein